jgi:hypothetical protein
MEEGYWHSLWQAYKERDPQYVVEFDGVPFVWVYKVGPVIDEDMMEHVVNARFGDELLLLGYDVEPGQVQPGQTIQLTLYWEALRQPTGDYTVFTHLLAPDGQLAAQQDNQPQQGMYPTNFWQAGERVQDEYVLTVPAEAPPGDYVMAVGMYTLQTLERLPVTAQDGTLLPDRQVLVGGVVVRP